ncbi:MAG: STAS domain-containing protein [Mariprofundaceae bacterium]|nr:STAS domain-containing protein [Mariprofundaceae bacterium]
MKLDVTVETNGAGVVKVAVEGTVNIHTSPRLRDALKPLFVNQNKEIHIRLSGVPFMDSSGIATLVEGLQWARQSGGRFTLYDLQDTVRDLFSLAKLDSVFDIAEGNIEEGA